MRFRLFLLISLSVLVFSFSSLAKDNAEGSREEDFYMTSDFIQLPPLWIPTYNEQKKFRKMQVFTGRLFVSEVFFKNICLNVPKITDKVILYLNRHPLFKDNLDQKHLAILGQDILASVNKDLGLEGIRSFELHRGDIKQTEEAKLINSNCNNMRLTKE